MVINKDNGGRFGNQLFGYAFAWLLARALGYALQSRQFQCFPNTKENLDGKVVEGPEERVTDTIETFGEIVGRCVGRRVIVRGHFERAEFYLPHRDVLRWLFDLPERPAATGKIVFHFRGTDFRGVRKEVPLAFYLEAWDALGNPRNVIAVTDDLDYPLVKQFCVKTDAIVQRGRYLDDFGLMMSARALVISRSTFAWWAAFLSDAKVIFPVMNGGDTNQFRNLNNPEWTQIGYDFLRAKKSDKSILSS